LVSSTRQLIGLDSRCGPSDCTRPLISWILSKLLRIYSSGCSCPYLSVLTLHFHLGDFVVKGFWSNVEPRNSRTSTRPPLDPRCFLQKPAAFTSPPWGTQEASAASRLVFLPAALVDFGGKMIHFTRECNRAANLMWIKAINVNEMWSVCCSLL